MELVIGSMAMSKYVPSRSVKDVDLFTNGAQTYGDCFWHDGMLEYWPDHTHRYATLDELYTIKVSHSYWELKNGSWEKHMADIVTLQKKGATLIPELHKLLYMIWEEKHGKKRVNLQQDKEEFFDDAVKRIYDHDSIHYSVAYGEFPIYESVFTPGASIAMDMAKIKALPFDQQVRLYREEVYATALERWVIPTNYRISPRLAYSRALKKTITSLTKGWSAKFLVEHYQIFRTPDMDYVAHHKSKAHQLIKL